MYNFAILGPTDKNTHSIIVVLMLHIKCQFPSSSGSLVLLPPKKMRNSQTDRRTHGRAQTNMPPQLLQSWDITTINMKSYGPKNHKTYNFNYGDVPQQGS